MRACHSTSTALLKSDAEIRTQSAMKSSRKTLHEFSSHIPHVGIIKTACCVADFGSIREPKCGKSEFRVARIRVCPEIGVDPQTLMRYFVAVMGPICAPLPPLLHRQHKFRSTFLTS
jgi:hypothetical protein